MREESGEKREKKRYFQICDLKMIQILAVYTNREKKNCVIRRFFFAALTGVPRDDIYLMREWIKGGICEGDDI